MTICPKSTIKRKGSSTTTHSSVEPYNGTLDCIKSKVMDEPHLPVA